MAELPEPMDTHLIVLSRLDEHGEPIEGPYYVADEPNADLARRMALVAEKGTCGPVPVKPPYRAGFIRALDRFTDSAGLLEFRRILLRLQ